MTCVIAEPRIDEDKAFVPGIVEWRAHPIQICRHHCPVSHVAEEFPELCETERDAFAEVLGTHVQRLATIVNADDACTTHVPPSPTSH